MRNALDYNPDTNELGAICPVCGEWWDDGAFECGACGCTTNECGLSENDTLAALGACGARGVR